MHARLVNKSLTGQVDSSNDCVANFPWLAISGMICPAYPTGGGTSAGVRSW
jgi:hypothetical protein